ncbi:MAG: 3-dehydroquinate synthase [Anaerovoracaceae bacterium]
MELSINTEQGYKVLIESPILDTIGARIGKMTPTTKICIVTDENIHKLYTKTIEDSFIRIGNTPHKVVFPASEGIKNFENLQKLVNYLAAENFKQSDILIALGGGVIGDLTGFAASIYLRGIRFYQIPTTLLAAVDSSVGGKNGINLSAGKNLVGTVHQPSGVFIDAKVLESLNGKEILGGIAEMIKAGVIADPTLFEDIEKAGKEYLGDIIEQCIYKSLAVKKWLVEADTYDNGERHLLNLGHTIAHALEKLSNYKISHGMAVAKGLAFVCNISVAKGYMKEEVATRIRCLLLAFGLDLTIDYTADQIYERALADKKIRNDAIFLVLPYDIGDTRIEKIQLNKLKDYLKLGFIEK